MKSYVTITILVVSPKLKYKFSRNNEPQWL